MKKTQKSKHILIFSLYLFILSIVLFFRGELDIDLSTETISERLRISANFVPFLTIKNYLLALEHGNISSRLVFINLVGNSILFLPMGIFLPALIKNCRFVRFFLTSLMMIIAVEAVQIVTGLGKFDVDDIILNLAGAVVGYAIYAVYCLIRPNKHKNAV